MAHHVGADTPALPLTSSPPRQLQGGMVLQRDLAKLVDKDPDTRRSAMTALKGYIEGELDVKSMPYFLDQVSGESNKGEASRTYAISLFVEVARVHKELTIPYIPRIMATITRSLLSSAGSQTLHHACAEVVSSVARYAMEPPYTGVFVGGEDVLRSLCDPLFGILCNKVEPVAVGGATCLQALVESEKWKFAAGDIVRKLCHRAAMAVGEKGTQTVSHMNLVRSLAKFNSEALKEHGAHLLKAGVEILLAAAGACGSWQQRAAAAQLLNAVLRIAVKETLASELVPTTEALERCRLDKVAVVRRAVGDALHVAKFLAVDMDKLFLQNGGLQEAPTPPRRLSEPSRRGRRKSLSSTDEVTRSQAKGRPSGPLESKLVSYESSPSVSASSTSSTGNSSTRSGRSPLYPAKQSPAVLASSTDKYAAESGLEYILARLKSSESKENAPLIVNSVDPPLPMKSNDSNDILHESKGLTEHGQDGDTADERGLSSYDVEQEICSVVSEEEPGCLSQASNTEDEALIATYDSRDIKSAGSSGLRIGTTDMELQRTSIYGSMSSTKALSESTDGEDCLDFVGEDVFLGDGSKQVKSDLQSDFSQDNRGPAVANVLYNSLAHVANLEAAVSPPQVVKTRMAAEDFLLFATPRRMVRSLQSASSTPEPRFALEGDLKEELEPEFETLSESGWSVRDNPIADDSEDESLKTSFLVDLGLKRRASIERWPSQKGSVMMDCFEHNVPFLAGGSASIVSPNNASPSAAIKPIGCTLEVERGDHLVCDTNKLGIRETDKSKVEAECHEVVNYGDIEKAPLIECDVTAEIIRNNSRKETRERGLKGSCVTQGSVFVRTWKKATDYIEIFLGSALCVVLLLGMAIVISSCLNKKNGIHVLVPT